jgi:hypothetical protein
MLSTQSFIVQVVDDSAVPAVGARSTFSGDTAAADDASIACVPVKGSICVCS